MKLNAYQRYFMVIALILLLSGFVMSSAAVAAEVGQTVKIRVAANIRGGPGVDYGIVSSAKRGDVFGVKAVDRGWYRIGDGRWVSWIVTTEYCTEDSNC